MDRKAFIMFQMVEYNMPDMKRIKHAMKVAGFAEAIASAENVESSRLEILVCAAILHDIGIHMAEKLYNSTSGFYQQKLGPSVAATFLEKAGFNTEEQGEICYLIAHHHTYTLKENKLLQILIEADAIVNAQEGDCDAADRDYESLRNEIFVTETGKKYFDIFILGKNEEI